jgi:plasmid stabilization system protein ParE
VSLAVSISGRAEADLSHQYRWYLDNADTDVAERFLRAFDSTVARLGGFPELGRRRRFRAPELTGIRSFPVGGRFGVHLIFYRSDGRQLSVERVMHGARDLPRRLLEPPGE